MNRSKVKHKRNILGLVCFFNPYYWILLSRLTAFEGAGKKDIQEKMCASIQGLCCVAYSA
ncbi:hypothetical protein DMH88_07800 [Escherichia coli]|nr:hypothetical protein [Escherichia coli]